MVGFFSLSNELRLKVLSSSDTTQTAATLSRVDKQMHSLWIMYNNHILKEVLPNQIIAYDDAGELAILEEIWFKKNTELTSKTSGQPRVRLYLSTLLHNAKLAVSATDSLKASREKKGAFLHRELCSDVTSYHIAYYRMRKIILGHLHPEAHIQHVMHWTIKISPGDDNSVLAEFNNFLAFDKMRYRTARNVYQRTPIERRSTNANGEKEAEPQPHEFALLHGSVLADHWRYVSAALCVWRIDIFRINAERLLRDSLVMKANSERLQNSTLVMESKKGDRQQNILTVRSDADKLQNNAAAVTAMVEKMQTDVVEAKLHGSRSFRGP
jgi:hypothetical protein